MGPRRRSAPWVRAVWVVLYGWIPAGIAWQLTHANQLDAYCVLGWFCWPVVALVYFVVATIPDNR